MALSGEYFTAETSLSTVRGVTATPSSAAPSAPPGARSVVLRSGVYADSVKLMQVSRDIGARDGVTAVLVAMATPLNLELATNMGLAPDEHAAAEAAVDAALTARERSTGSAAAIPQRTIGAGLDDLPPGGEALAIISVPGAYAVAEAADAIAAGRSVLVFSDGVPVEQEVALKHAGHDAGVLVMGP